MSRGSERMRRINELLREVIASEVVRLKDPGIGFVTITGVDTTPDLRAARIYYTVLGEVDEREETLKALRRAAPRIRSAVGEQVTLKYLPVLEFHYDEAIERGIRMEQLLRQLEKEGDGDRDITP
ncbi:MAG: 30S ribosome-binding factor RbfA [Acidimicrobiia bacterium]